MAGVVALLVLVVSGAVAGDKAWVKGKTTETALVEGVRGLLESLLPAGKQRCVTLDASEVSARLAELSLRASRLASGGAASQPRLASALARALGELARDTAKTRTDLQAKDLGSGESRRRKPSKSQKQKEESKRKAAQRKKKNGRSRDAYLSESTE